MTIKKSIITAVIVITIISCTACGQSKEKVKTALLGTWEYSWSSLTGKKCVMKYQFKLDDIVIYDFDGATTVHSEGTYSIENSKIVCKWNDYSSDTIFKYSMQGNSIYLEGGTEKTAGYGEQYLKK